MAFPAQSSVSPIYEVFPDVPERWRTAHQRGLAGEVVIAQEDYFERLDGRMQWLRWEIHPWYTSGMDVGGIFIFAEEITSRKQAEEALRRSEALYRAIGESIDYGVWICSPDGRNTYASESFLKRKPAFDQRSGL